MIRILAVYIILISNLHARETAEVMFEAGPLYVGTDKYELPLFYLDSFEVSNAEYADFVNKVEVNKPLSFKMEGFSDPQKPAAGMDWYDASLYCRFKGKRLPRMIEFIRASQGQVPQLYPFGNEFPSFQKAPFITHSQKPLSTSSVNSFHELRTYEGVYQLAGNVAEWTEDYADQPLAILENPELAKKFKGKGKYKVYGGSYRSSVQGVKVGSFIKVQPTENYHPDIGFRCARDENTPIFTSSDFLTMNPNEMKALVYGSDEDKKEEKILNITTKRSVAKIQNRQKNLDEKERRRRLKVKSLKTLRDREILVSEEKEGKTSASIIVPYGMFMMGDSQLPVASPQRMIYLDAFEIDRYLVTIQEFEAFTTKNKMKPRYNFKSPGGITKANLAYVTWNHARAYCKQLDMDLPSEAQWEKTVQGLAEEKKITLDSKGIPTGYFGIKQVVQGFDEWTLDSFAPYEMVEKNLGYRNPTLDLPHSSFKVYRGHGSSPKQSLNISTRNISHHLALHSFRCVRNLGDAGNPKFEISRKMNYLTPDFYDETRKLISSGKNPLNIKIDMGEFENKN